MLKRLTQLFEEDEKTHVMTFMRANPITVGHEKVVNRVTDMARDLGASHEVVLSHSHDGQKNPLTAEQKLKHARRAFPGVNVRTSSPERPSLLYNAADAYKRGAKHLHLVVGQDRVEGFRNLLNNYNGKEGDYGHFNFKSITVHSAGERDPDAEGVEGMSATKMRQAAQMGNRDLFHAGAPSRMAPEHREEMMQDVIKGIVPPAPKKPRAKKLKEETVTGSVGGLGFNSGNPAAGDDGIDDYVSTNALAADKQNGALLKMMKHVQVNLLRFSEFKPNSRDKSLAYYNDDENAELLKRDKIRNRGKDNNATKG